MLILTASVLAADENPQPAMGRKPMRWLSEAVKLTDGQQPAALDVLAMAYAETGKFDDAMLVEQQAIKLAEGRQEDDLDFLQKRLEPYQPASAVAGIVQRAR